ncbi:hypothetical protein MBM_00011 [Drepanopeziza brunnea f. sp. 'multigermtubi' MB_m1]|uniref:Uncharacterized protein n=1 Tax=Marssonina brunnea f. sp. multigermtubi (strain MB_m1) TaxID=1072389 RepID=K1XJN3_MARBU|nr:uncharacterized protein MBM_00011 [Drepanopeziza brunnea f. sp. 'multigermtubi' MB_m1]EKD20898.1 hypothetical protein MBM_00011 [Drepanopeziza brunnea f. sp. 'multigermtubi' MB_m1]
MAGNTPPQNSGREDPKGEKADHDDDDLSPRAAASVFSTANNNSNNNNNTLATASPPPPPPPSRSQHGALSILSERPHSAAAAAAAVQSDRTPSSPSDESKGTQTEKTVPSWLKAAYRKFPRKSSQKSQHDYEHDHDDQNESSIQVNNPSVLLPPRGPSPSSSASSAPPARDGAGSGSGSGDGNSRSGSMRIDALLGFRLRPAAGAGRPGDEFAPQEPLLVGMAMAGGDAGAGADCGGVGRREDAEWTERSPVGGSLAEATSLAGVGERGVELGEGGRREGHEEGVLEEMEEVRVMLRGGAGTEEGESEGEGEGDGEDKTGGPAGDGKVKPRKSVKREIPKEVIAIRQMLQANPGMATHPFAIQGEAAIEALLDDTFSPTHELNLRNVKLMALVQSQRSALDFQTVMEKQLRSEMREVYAANAELRGKLAAAEEQRGGDGDRDDAEKCQKKCRELEKRIEEMQAEINEYEDGNFMTEDDCAQMSADRDRRHQEDTEDLKADIEKGKREHSSLQNKFKELEKVHEQTKQELLVEKGSNSKVFREIKVNELKQANDKIEELEEENKRAIKAQEERFARREESLARHTQCVADADAQVRKLNEQHDAELVALRQKHLATEERIAALESQLKVANDVKDILARQMGSRTEAATAAQTALEKRIKDLELTLGNAGPAKVAELKRQIADLNDQASDIAALKAEVARLQRALEECEGEKKNKPDTDKSLQEQIKEVRRRARESIDKLYGQGEELSKRGVATDEQLVVYLEQQNKTLRNQNEALEEKAKTAGAGRTEEPVLDPTRVGYSPEAFEKYKSLAENVERMNAEIRTCRAEHRPKAEEINRAALEASKNMNAAWERKMELLRAAAKVKKDAEKAKSAEKRRKRRQWAERVLDKAEVYKQRAKDAATARAAIAAQGGLAEIKKQAGYLEEETKLLEAKAKVREAQEKQAALEADIKKLDEAREEDAKMLNPYKKWLADSKSRNTSLIAMEKLTKDIEELLDQSLPITHPERVQARVDSRYAYGWQQVNGAIYAINDALVKMQAKRALYGKQEGDCAAATESGNLAVRLATDFSKKFEDRKDPQLIARSALWAAIAQYYSGDGETAQKLLETVVPKHGLLRRWTAARLRKERKDTIRDL